MIKAIRAAKSVIIFTHRDPDGDALGCMIAVHLALKGLKKKADMFCCDTLPEMYTFLPHSDKIRTSIDKSASYDLAIVVDCGDIRRIDCDIDVKSIAKSIINIDHHPDNTKFGDINLIEKVSSVAEIIYKLFVEMKITITKDIAECLYVGIMTDTGNFRYDYTTPETIDMAATLARAGAEISKIAMAVYETKTMSSVRILGAAMYRLECTDSGKVAWTVLPKQLMDSLGAKSEDLTGLVDHIRSIKGVEVAILFREESDGIKVNFRSKFEVNVSDIAKQLGGGGHIRASGAIMHGELEEVKQKVLNEVFKVVK